jgi:hypothetical protein
LTAFESIAAPGRRGGGICRCGGQGGITTAALAHLNCNSKLFTQSALLPIIARVA